MESGSSAAMLATLFGPPELAAGPAVVPPQAASAKATPIRTTGKRFMSILPFRLVVKLSRCENCMRMPKTPTWMRSGHRHAREVVEDQLRPGLHVQVVAPHGVEWQQCARKLVHFADRDLWPVALHQKDQPDVHPANRRRLVVDRPQ